MGLEGKHLTYREAGVSIEAGERFARAVGELARVTHRREVLAGIGGFAALTRLPRRLRDPVIVTSTDGVGTKLKVAQAMNRHSTIGIDLVAMCVNDLITVGAHPLCFLDYYATARLEPAKALAVLKGVVRGCMAAGCSLVGGETAELPSFYSAGSYELAGFAVGVVERSKIIDGRRIRPGDAVVGLRSSGLHSNGYSLARKVLLEHARLSLAARPPGWRRSVGAELLAPTRIYVKQVRAALAAGGVSGMAHITGGGLPGNLIRVLPQGCRAVIDRGAWEIPPVFTTIKEMGNVTQEEMDRTFNNGIGFVFVISQGAEKSVLAALARAGERTYSIGRIERGVRRVIIT